MAPLGESMTTISLPVFSNYNEIWNKTSPPAIPCMINSQRIAQ